jgi:deoxyribonuclease V
LDKAETDFFSRIVELIGSPPKQVNLPESIERICGVDAAYSEHENRVVAAASLFENGKLIETVFYSGNFTFPYVSGLFFLHEGPFVVEAVKRLKVKPDLVCFDAHGAAHPKFKGLATICGMVLEMPSVGIAKRQLLKSDTIPHRDNVEKITFEGREIGFATSNPKRFWSSGNGVSMDQLEKIILSENRQVCLGSLKEAHGRAKDEMSSIEAKKS